MYAYDFEYDGKLLSEFGMMVCSFSENRSASTTEKGSEINFNLVPSDYGKRLYTAGLQYENYLSTTFQICKCPDCYPEDKMDITSIEFRELSRWLNRKKFLWFRSFDLQEPEKEKPWFRASFSLSRVESGSKTIGVELNMITNSPFGYGEEKEVIWEFSQNSLSAILIDENDEIGDTYPKLKITCGQSGTMTISDDLTGCSCSVENCVSGEVLNFGGENMIITTSNTNHDLANDFNYDFFRFANTYKQRENIITVSMPCTVELRYRPIWKDTL